MELIHAVALEISGPIMPLLSLKVFSPFLPPEPHKVQTKKTSVVYTFPLPDPLPQPLPLT